MSFVEVSGYSQSLGLIQNIQYLLWLSQPLYLAEFSLQEVS